VGVVTDSSRLEFFVLGLEVEVMHQAGKMFGSFDFALDECLVDDQLHGDVCQFIYGTMPLFLTLMQLGYLCKGKGAVT
jgi:hypothetical protein